LVVLRCQSLGFGVLETIKTAIELDHPFVADPCGASFVLPPREPPDNWHDATTVLVWHETSAESFRRGR
jgi:hypothetical protein